MVLTFSHYAYCTCARCRAQNLQSKGLHRIRQHQFATGVELRKCDVYFSCICTKPPFNQSINQSLFQAHGPYESREDRQKIFTTDRPYTYIQEAQLSPSDRAMRLVSSNLANYHATVQKLLIRQVLTKPIVWSWRFSSWQCVINKPTTVELCISPVYRRLAVAKFSKSTM